MERGEFLEVAGTWVEGEEEGEGEEGVWEVGTSWEGGKSLELVSSWEGWEEEAGVPGAMQEVVVVLETVTSCKGGEWRELVDSREGKVMLKVKVIWEEGKVLKMPGSRKGEVVLEVVAHWTVDLDRM